MNGEVGGLPNGVDGAVKCEEEGSGEALKGEEGVREEVGVLKEEVVRIGRIPSRGKLGEGDAPSKSPETDTFSLVRN